MEAVRHKVVKCFMAWHLQSNTVPAWDLRPDPIMELFPIDRLNFLVDVPNNLLEWGA
jgi:hypothetical protein